MGRRGVGRRVDDARDLPANGGEGLSLALQAAADAQVGRPRSLLGMRQARRQVADLAVQQLHLAADAGRLWRVGGAQVAFGVAAAVAQGLELAFRAAEPVQVLPERGRPVRALRRERVAVLQVEGRLAAGQQRDDGLLVAQGLPPFALTIAAGGGGVRRQQQQHRAALLQRGLDLSLRRQAGPHVAAVQPHRHALTGKRVVEGLGPRDAIGGAVADENAPQRAGERRRREGRSGIAGQDEGRAFLSGEFSGRLGPGLGRLHHPAVSVLVERVHRDKGLRGRAA